MNRALGDEETRIGLDGGSLKDDEQVMVKERDGFRFVFFAKEVSSRVAELNAIAEKRQRFGDAMCLLTANGSSALTEVKKRYRDDKIMGRR